MRVPREKLKEQQLLSDLSSNQVELALEWLHSPVQSPPPEELESLSQLEWFLLDRMLASLLHEKQQNRLH
jgi:hypothetical protein